MTTARSCPYPKVGYLAVLRLVAAGWTNAEIAAELGIGYNTVVRRVSKLGGRLCVGNRMALVIRALQLGWLDLEEIEIKCPKWS